MIRLNFRNQLGRFDLKDTQIYALDGTKNISHTDLIRLKEGKLSGQFWAIFAECSSQGKDALRIHLEQIDTIKRMIAKYPDSFHFATKSSGNFKKLNQPRAC